MLKLQYMRKISFTLLASLLLSLSLPVLAYAASIIKIAYDATSGQISGVIYSDNPTVSLAVYENGQTTDITSAVGSAQPSVTEGVYFFNVEGNIGLGKKLEKITVTDSTYEDLAPTVTEMTYMFDKDDVPPAPNFRFLYYRGDYTARTYTVEYTWDPMNVPDLAGYNVYVDGQIIDSVHTTNYTVSNVQPGTELHFGVSAVDKAGQESSIESFSLRLPGMFESITIHTDGKPAGYALKPGDAFITFTPSSVFPAGSSLDINMPGFVVDPNVEAADFELVKTDGTVIPVTSATLINNYLLRLVTSGDLSNTQQYILRMSSHSDGTEIKLPNLNKSNQRIYVSLHRLYWLEEDQYMAFNLVIGDPFPPAKPSGLKAIEGDGQITVSWDANKEADLAGYNVYLDGKLLTETPITATTYTITGLVNGKTYHVNVAAVDKTGNKSLQVYIFPTPKASTNTGGGGGYVPVTPAGPAALEEPGVRIVNESSLKNDQGKVAVTIGKGDKQVLLPANSGAITKDSIVSFSSDELTAEIPGSLIDQLRSLVSADALKDAQIVFSFDKLTAGTVQSLLAESQKKEKNTNVKAAGEVYEFTLSIKTKDGKEQKLTAFDKPIMLKLKVADGANSKLLGVYYIADDGTLEYVGGKLKDQVMTAEVHHFSTYAVLEYSKSFDDVNHGHWAADAIKEMAAAHVITGVSDNQFAPSKQVTRAEFAAFLVRKLGLKANGSSPFADVDAKKWYADEVAAAAQAGLVTGRTNNTFAPDDTVTRQEMVVMLMKARALSTGENIDSAADVDFTDKEQIGEWAKSYVNAAFKLGFIQGRGDQLFVPKGTATRAEAAMLIAKL